MQHAILNKSWKQQPTKQQLYGHQLPISQIVQVRRTSTDLHQLCTDAVCNLEDLLEVMDDRDGWTERERERESQSAN